MSDTVRIELQPLGSALEVPRGLPLREALFARGVEFPCGGRGICRGCRVRVLKGDDPAAPETTAGLRPAEVAEGWRLACRLRADGPLVLEVAQWELAILSDDDAFEFTPGTGHGIAVDLGTTTLVAQLVDLATGRVLAVQSALNPQARHGADIMSRIQFAAAGDGLRTLASLVRGEIGRLIAELLKAPGAGDEALRRVVIVGNSAMHHLFGRIDVAPLANVPFQPVHDGPQSFRSRELGWDLPGDPPVHFLPCLGGFVGSDILAGILATGLHESRELAALADLGTNGEVVLGTRDRLWVASTAAGPAFEGAKISMGMRAATGAISEVSVEGGALRCGVLGGGPPRGICGSGLVDAAAAGLELGRIAPSGRMEGGEMVLSPPVRVTQADVRELQLAKGAIAAGFRILLERAGAKVPDVKRLYLAGAFGNYVNRASARRIGLLEFPLEVIHPAGNTALRGAKMALFVDDTGWAALRSRVEHVPLAEQPGFLDHYGGAMAFPR
jgi:uncharacterized 2Fe-2S/4Fe-4S cluster protein (DUF4445 family)